MTVVAKGRRPGTLSVVVNERRVGRETEFEIASTTGAIQVDLSIGAEVASAKRLKSNLGLSWMGVKMGADGFRVRPPMRASLIRSGFPAERLPLVIADSDVIDPPSEYYAIDCAGLTEEQLQTEFPAVYQYLNDHVRPMRDQNDPETNPGDWWRFYPAAAEARPLRPGVDALHSHVGDFQMSHLPLRAPRGRAHRRLRDCHRERGRIRPRRALFVHPHHLGHSRRRPHGRRKRSAPPERGVLRSFPLPGRRTPGTEGADTRRSGGLDGLHARVLTDHRDITLSDVYKVIEVLELVRAGTRTLSDSERDIYNRGLASMIEHRLSTINALVASAYDLDVDLPAEDILNALVDLNRRRETEETAGLVGYLRPALQAPAYAAPALQLFDLRIAAPERQLITWPSNLAEQVTAVANVLSASTLPLRANDVASAFKGKRSGTVVPVLEALAAMGQARKLRDGRYAPQHTSSCLISSVHQQQFPLTALPFV